MPTRPDLRQIATNVKDALADCDRDTLLDLLTFVLKEYVVEGPPPMLMHQAETIADLGGLSFAQLISALQTRLELPELALFAVDGERVSVRVGGVMQPLDASRLSPAATATMDLPRPQAGVHVVEATLMQRPPAAQAAPSAPAAAPRPTAGLSLRGQPTAGGGGGGAPAPAPAAPAAPATPPAAPAPAAASDKKDTPDGDDASARFSLLELD